MFKKGISGNPNGRPKTKVAKADLREAIAESLPDIITMLVDKAKYGDINAAKILLDRCLPALKPQAEPVSIDLGEIGDGKAQTIATRLFNLMIRGEISANDAMQAMTALEQIAKVREAQDRIAASDSYSYRAIFLNRAEELARNESQN